MDAYAGKDSSTLFAQSKVDDERIGFNESSFAWSADTDGSLTPSKRKYLLKIERELLFKPKSLNLIIGPTGSGKTSILMALLGEMHYIPNGPSSWFNLPRKNGVAYAAQESWVQNETIRVSSPFFQCYLLACSLVGDSRRTFCLARDMTRSAIARSFTSAV